MFQFSHQPLISVAEIMVVLCQSVYFSLAIIQLPLMRLVYPQAAQYYHNKQQPFSKTQTSRQTG